MNSQNSKSIRDSAIGPIVLHIQDDDPSAAIEWAASITNDQTRQMTLEQTFSNWLEDDPDAARKGIESASLNTDEYKELLQIFEENLLSQ